MSEVIRPFTISATDLNLADTQEITLADLSTSSRLLRVPLRLELYWPATTAYTFGSLQKGYRPEQIDSQGTQEFHAGGKFLVVRDSFYHVLFRVKLEGFLDQTVAAAYRLALPVGGIELAPASSGFYLRSTCAISGGAGSLTGRIYYEELALPEA